jgi:hypothetical protein
MEDAMFGEDKRMVLTLMIGLLASSWGCSAIIAHSGYSIGELTYELFHTQTRTEVREKFGEPDEIKTCPEGKVLESYWIRQKIPEVFPTRLDGGLGGLFLFGLLETILFPVTLERSEDAKLHYAFVYDETGRVLYRYDLKIPPRHQFLSAVRSLSNDVYKQLEERRYDTWSSCITKYMIEAKQRANCIGYIFGPEDEVGFEDLLTVSEWVDSGQVPCEEGLIDVREILFEIFF